MAEIYVARSTNVSKWGAGVGLTKHLYKVGVTEDSAEAAVKAMNESAVAGETDWKLIKKETADTGEDTALARLSAKEKMVDPGLYPKIKGARGIYKVKQVNVENHFFVKQALADQETRDIKVKHPEFAEYLIRNAVG